MPLTGPLAPQGEDMLALVVENSAERVLVLDRQLRRVYANSKARRFLERHDIPDEIYPVARRIFDAIARQDGEAKPPGQIQFPRDVGESRWFFRLAYSDSPDPLVFVYFTAETVADRFDLNEVRQRYRLTRREVDVLRHLLDGLSNVQIAAELGIVEQTVKEYASSLYAKFGVADRFSLLRHLISAPSPPE